MFYILSEYTKYNGTWYNMKIITRKQRFNPRKDMNKKNWHKNYLFIYLYTWVKVIRLLVKITNNTLILVKDDVIDLDNFAINIRAFFFIYRKSFV